MNWNSKTSYKTLLIMMFGLSAALTLCVSLVLSLWTIEKSILVSAQQDAEDQARLLVSPNFASALRVGQTIAIDYNGKSYVSIINHLSFDPNTKNLALQIQSPNFNILPGAQFSAHVVTGNWPLMLAILR